MQMQMHCYFPENRQSQQIKKEEFVKSPSTNSDNQTRYPVLLNLNVLTCTLPWVKLKSMKVKSIQKGLY